MKVIVTKFYSILLDFKNFTKISKDEKCNILIKYFKDIEKLTILRLFN